MVIEIDQIGTLLRASIDDVFFFSFFLLIYVLSPKNFFISYCLKLNCGKEVESGLSRRQIDCFYL